MLAALDDDGRWIVELGCGSSTTSQSTAERALPVNDSVGRVVSLEHVVVDEKSFVAHARVEVHRLTCHA